jgi:hypothetical protein
MNQLFQRQIGGGSCIVQMQNLITPKDAEKTEVREKSWPVFHTATASALSDL